MLAPSHSSSGRTRPAGRSARSAAWADELDAFEERAAIAEYDGGLPREHAEVLAALCSAPPPAGASPEQFNSVVDAAARFLELRAAVVRGR